MLNKNSVKLIVKKFSKSRIILFSTIFLSVILSVFLDQTFVKQELTNRKSAVHKMTYDLELAFKQYLHPLQGTQSIYNGLDFEVSPEMFRKASESRGMYKNFEGALGFGFIRRVKNTDLKSYVNSMSKNESEFKLKPISSQGVPNNSNYHFIIETIEPAETNKPALGLLISDEPNRRNAAIKSMRSGDPTITKTISLVQSGRKEPGFLFYLPLYRSPTKPKTVEEREAQLVGWAYTPLLASKIVHFVLKQNRDFPEFKIFEIDKNKSLINLFVSKDFKDSNTSATLKEDIKIFGQTWQLHVQVQNKALLIKHALAFTFFLFLMSCVYILYNYILSIEKEILNKTLTIEFSRKEVAKATKEIKTQADFLQIILNGLPSMVSYWDKNLNNKLSNTSYKKFNFKEGIEKLNFHISDTYEFKSNKFIKKRIDAALDGKAQIFEMDVNGPSDKKYRMLVRYIPDLFENKVYGFIAIASDITEIRDLEIENKKRQATLYSKSKLSTLGEMAAGIAHEINNPLAIIGANAQLIKKLGNDSKFKTHKHKDNFDKKVHSIVATVDRIAKIVKGLKTFARDSEKDPHLPFKLIISAYDTLGLIKEKVMQQNVTLTIIEQSKDVVVTGNKTQVEQVLMNLVSNSIDAIHDLDDKWIKIFVGSNHTCGFIRIQDSGSGITDDIAEKLKQPFFTTKAVGSGMGLGLSISSGIMGKHKGSLDYELYEGHTSFILKMPLRLADDQAA